MIGGPARLHFITTQIFAFQRLGTENGLLMSIAFSSLLMVSSLLLFFGLKLFDDVQKVSMVGGKSSRPSLVELGKLKVPVLITILSFLFIVLIMPFLSLLFSSLSETQGVISLTNIGFKNFSRILFSTEETPRAFYNSFLLSISAGLVITILSFFTAYVQSRSDNKTRNWIEGIVNLPFSTPGTILAISMILVFSQSFWGRWSLYNSLGLLLVAYILKFFSLSLKTLTESFSQIHQSLEEAAQLCGASRFRILIDIYFPILRPALFATFFLIMMPCLSELTMTLLLSGPGQETLGILIYQLQEYSDMGGGGAAVISTLILTFILCFNLAYHLLQERRSIA